MPSLPSHYPTSNHGQDLTDWLVRHGRSVAELQDLLETAVLVEKPEEREASRGYTRFFGGRNHNKFMPMLLAREIMQDSDYLFDPETSLFYRWNGKWWAEYDLSFIRGKALNMLDVEASSDRAANVMGIVRDLTVRRDGRKMNDGEDLVCLQNGMFNLRTAELLPHEKEYYATHALGVSFDPQAKTVPDCPRWKKFLDEAVIDPAVIREVQKFFGYCLTRSTKYEKALLLVGPGGDGKSTLLKVLRHLVGVDNCSHVPMSKLDDPFYLALLVNKLLNVSTEVESRVFASDVFKALVSGDPVTASFKHQTPFSLIPFAKLAFSANEHPRFKDQSDGLFSRFLIVEMKGQFRSRGTADRDLGDKLLEPQELSGIYAWALVGLHLLRQEGFKDVAAIAQALQDYRTFNNNVLFFLEQHVRFTGDPQAKEIKDEVYAFYKRKCSDWNLLPVGYPQFARLFKQALPGLADDKKSDENGVRRNAYRGIVLLRVAGSDDPPAGGSPPPPPGAARPPGG